MNYNQWALAMQTLAGTSTNNTDTNLENMYPRIIEYAELRMYRDMDFLATSSSQTALMTANSRNVALPSNIVVLESLNAVTPVTATDPDDGTRSPLQRVSIEYLNAVWPSSTAPATPSIPRVYALLGNPSIASATITAGPINIIVGPAPDAAYTVECIGTVRPTPLSPQNTTTFLTTYMADMFVAACMIFLTGYQRDFGAQADDPKAAQSWESQYNLLKQGVNVEEMRKKSQAPEWAPYNPAPIANAPRDRASA